MNIIFMGTPLFAQIVLEKIYNSKHKVLAVICQPDRPNGRNNKVDISEAKKYALTHNLPIFQFEKLNEGAVSIIKNIKPDIIVTAAYGQMISQEIINIPHFGIINVHGSLLPKYRGASPIQTAILKGETETGITILQTQAGMDDGDMILQKKLTINADDNALTLSIKLAHLGGDLVVDALDLIQNGKATFSSQNAEEATFCKPLKKQFAFLDFGLSANFLVNKIRAYNPSPVAKIMLNGEVYKVFSAKVISGDFSGENGEVIMSSSKQGLVIKCNKNAIEILELQPTNGKKMLAKAYLNGKTIPLKSVCQWKF